MFMAFVQAVNVDKFCEFYQSDDDELFPSFDEENGGREKWNGAGK